MSSPKRIPKKTKPAQRTKNFEAFNSRMATDSNPPGDETISVPRADIYRLAAAARIDHRTVIAFLAGRKVYAMTADAIRRGAASIGIKLPADLAGEQFDPTITDAHTHPCEKCGHTLGSQWIKCPKCGVRREAPDSAELAAYVRRSIRAHAR